MHVTVDSCRQILEQTFPQIRIHNLSVIQSGWDTLVLVVNDRYIFRFPRRPELEAQLEKEMGLLPLLTQVLPVPVPQVEFACRKSAGEAHTLMGYPKIPGIGLDAIATVSDEVVGQVGEFLTALHRMPGKQFQSVVGGSTSPEEWRRKYQDMYAWAKDLAFPYLSKPDELAASLLWEVYLSDADNFSFRPKLIHGDLGPEHILCQPDVSAVCGVIDWGDARLGDPALDFAGLFSLDGEELVDRTLSFYQEPVDETFRRRVRFYYTIMPFYEIRYALTIEDEAHLKHAIASLNTNLRV